MPRGRRSRLGAATVHRQILPPTDVATPHGIPTTTPARTIIDLSRQIGPELLQKVYDDLVRRGQLRPGALQRRLSDPVLPRHDRPVLDDLLGHHRTIGGSAKENWIVDTLVGAGFPAPERHVMVELGGRLREVGCAYPELKIAIEYDSWAFHRDETHFHGDRDKFTLMVLAGCIVLPVTSAWDEGKLVGLTREAFEKRGRYPAAVSDATC